jgi:hypothetical protein
MIEILNHLWINYDLIDKNDINKLKYYIEKNKIRNIIILSDKIDYLNLPKCNEINYKICYNDNKDTKSLNNELYKKIFEITFLIYECLKKKNKVIIIGHNNNQDIDCIICAYFIRYAKVSPNKAIEYLKTKKKHVFKDNIIYYDVLDILYKDNK